MKNLLRNGLLTLLIAFAGAMSYGQGFTLSWLNTANNQLAECDTMVDINIAAMTAPSTNADWHFMAHHFSLLNLPLWSIGAMEIPPLM